MMDGIFQRISPIDDRLRRLRGEPRHGMVGIAAMVLVGLMLNVLSISGGMAQDDSAKPASAAVPMPPVRPPTLATPAPRVATAPPQTTNPDVTGESSASPWTPGKLLKLPPYTRARMHECALEWQRMKANGTATEKIWFTFAQTCLVR